jgi:hypothetical protein
MSAGFIYERSSPHPNGTLPSPLAASVDFALATLGDAVELVGLADVAATVSAMIAVSPALVSKRWSRKSRVRDENIEEEESEAKLVCKVEAARPVGVLTEIPKRS